MDKKATRKIIGILSAIALVIIVLPLIINGNPHSAALQTAEVNAPPFPEPRNETDPIPTGMIVENNLGTKKAVSPVFPSTQVITTALEAKEEIDKAEQYAMQAEQSQAKAMALATKTHSADNVLILDGKGSVTVVQRGRVQAKSNLSANLPTAISAQTLSADLNNLKKAAWVVQMGSFRNKDNALNLTNKLRAKGYKAFTYETKHNGQTCVYVGPEFKQASASLLVNRITKEINMPGVVIKYNPLEI